MGKKKPPVSFFDEVTERFQFLVTDYGFSGPELTELLLQCATYHSDALEVSTYLSYEGASATISVSITLRSVPGRNHADLDHLVEAAGLAPFHLVRGQAHSGDAMRRTLDDNALWIRRLLPVLDDPGAADLLATPLKRRAQNVKWRYA
jgi:hypothetical protein